MRNQMQPNGFSLIELMITLLVFAIIAAVAYPSYQGYARKAHRTAAKTSLLEVASREERFFSTNNNYTANLATLGYATTNIAGVPVMQVPTDGTPYYNVRLGVNATGYIITAIPIAASGQTQDTECEAFTLDSLGQKGIAPAAGVNPSGTAAQCWQ
jgi:type IV pilus assembly protein PilE